MVINFSIIQSPDRATYDRLFQDALPQVSVERKRLGEDGLREGMWQGLTDPQNKIYQMEVDGYVTAYICYRDFTYMGQPYRWLQHPTVGCDVNGSKAWYYSEEFKAAEQAFDAEQGHAGVLTLYNEGTPAALSMEKNFGSYSTIETFSLEEFENGLFRDAGMPDTMRVMVVTWSN